MRRPHTLLILLFAIAVTAGTYFFPPAFPEDQGKVEHGFPFPWAFQTDLPGSGLPIPIIGWLIKAAEVTTLTFKWQWFLADIAIYCSILFFVFDTFGRENDEKT